MSSLLTLLSSKFPCLDGPAWELCKCTWSTTHFALLSYFLSPLSSAPWRISWKLWVSWPSCSDFVGCVFTNEKVKCLRNIFKIFKIRALKALRLCVQGLDSFFRCFKINWSKMLTFIRIAYFLWRRHFKAACCIIRYIYPKTLRVILRFRSGQAAFSCLLF